MSVENFAKVNSPPTEQAHAVLARSRSCCHRATTSTVVRRFFRGTASLYIFSILFSRKSRVPLDAAFSYLFLFIPRLLFLPQGLFPPPGFISILLLRATGIISAARIHLYLALFFRRDYFCRPASSLSCSFVLQGLFLPPGFIPILLFCAAGMISSAQMHPQLAFCAAGMISSAQMHPQLAFFFRRDYFFRPDSSLSCSFLPQGLLRPPGFISILLFCAAGMISSAQMHPQLAFLCCRDYFRRPDSSPACSFLPQG